MYVENLWFLCIMLFTLGLIVGYSLFKVQTWLDLRRQDTMQIELDPIGEENKEVLDLKLLLKKREAEFKNYYQVVKTHYVKTTQLLKQVDNNYQTLSDHVQNNMFKVIDKRDFYKALEELEQNRVANQVTNQNTTPKNSNLTNFRTNVGKVLRVTERLKSSLKFGQLAHYRANRATAQSTTQPTAQSTTQQITQRTTQQNQFSLTSPNSISNITTSLTKDSPVNTGQVKINPSQSNKINIRINNKSDNQVSNDIENNKDISQTDLTKKTNDSNVPKVQKEEAIKKEVIKGTDFTVPSQDKEDQREVLFTQGHKLHSSGIPMRDVSIGVPKKK